MNIYISGPMRGVDNYDTLFRAAEMKLKEGGHNVANPADLDLDGLTREQMLNVYLAFLDLCDAIYLLDDWEESCGANREYGYAIATGKLVLMESTHND